MPTCATCYKTQRTLSHPRQRCSVCHRTSYCSVRCQRIDWKRRHKSICIARRSANVASSSRRNPGFNATNGLLGLSGDDYLHQLPEKDVFVQLIDCYRLRVEDKLEFSGNASGLHAGEDPRPGFRRFLKLAEKRPGLLPSWWNKQKRVQIEVEAMSGSGWSDINAAVKKSDIQEHYGDFYNAEDVEGAGRENISERVSCSLESG